MKREVQIDPQKKNTLKNPCLVRVKGLLLQTGVPKGDYSLHSLRSGSASVVANATIKERLCKRNGYSSF